MSIGDIMEIAGYQLDLFDLLLILGVLWISMAIFMPHYTFWSTRRRRLYHIRTMEREWGTRVLTMIHRKEAISFLGVPIYQYIDIEDAEEILRGIREAGDAPIDLILHTPGGQLHASIQIARALKGHKNKTRVMVPHYSMSGGTIIALAADEIIMDKDASLGPIDPQIGDMLRGVFPAPSWIQVAQKKDMDADDTTLIISDISRKAMDFMHRITRELVSDTITDEEKRGTLIEKLVGGEMIHSQPISAAEAIELGLPVSTQLPGLVHEFMKQYRSVRSSVEYAR
ncbi:MAG: ATP-dependent Clp protease proteolytic subunit [ANME-2 cluster archaeon]|nr:ATP-dependent Clp protease proteolytic subunit [ANME-2 cluster archaeon]